MRRRRLALFLALTAAALVRAQQQPPSVLLQLVQNTCLQSCYIQLCPDLDSVCVCRVVDTNMSAVVACSRAACAPPNGVANAPVLLQDECAGRKTGSFSTSTVLSGQTSMQCRSTPHAQR